MEIFQRDTSKSYMIPLNIRLDPLELRLDPLDELLDELLKMKLEFPLITAPLFPLVEESAIMLSPRL